MGAENRLEMDDFPHGFFDGFNIKIWDFSDFSNKNGGIMRILAWPTDTNMWKLWQKCGKPIDL